MTASPVTPTTWRSLTRDGSVGVEVNPIAMRSGLSASRLRFAPRATIDEHAAPFDIDVLCLSGRGWTSVGDSAHVFKADDVVRWPANVPHRLWTDDDDMQTLMLEHHE